MKHITATELAARLAAQTESAPVLLDVREPWEFDMCRIPNAVLVPMQTIPARWQEFDDAQEIICICHHGARSMQVAAYLEHQGFTNVTNLTGGVHAWAKEVDTSMPTY